MGITSHDQFGILQILQRSLLKSVIGQELFFAVPNSKRALTQKLVKWQCLWFVMQWFDKIFHLQTLVCIKYLSDFLTRFSPLFSRQVQRRRPLSRPAVVPLTIRRRRLRRLPPPQPRPTSSRLLQILWALLPKPCWPKCKQKCNYVLISKIAFACNKKLLGNILSWNQIIFGLAFTLKGIGGRGAELNGVAPT